MPVLSRLLLLGAAMLTSCAEQDAQFNVRSAPGFTPGRTTVSVFGVFRDGRLSPESWAEFGPPISAALGQKSCDIAYGEGLQKENPEMFSAVDDDARANGITEDMLDKFASMAKGELIMTISVHNRERQTIIATEGVDPLRAASMQQPKRGGGRRQPPGQTTVEGGVEIAASLYAVRLHRSMARVAMQYTGPSMEDALRRFVAKLNTLIPGSTCLGWSLISPREAP